jgi:hypothetical protein
MERIAVLQFLKRFHFLLIIPNTFILLILIFLLLPFLFLLIHLSLTIHILFQLFHFLRSILIYFRTVFILLKPILTILYFFLFKSYFINSSLPIADYKLNLSFHELIKVWSFLKLWEDIRSFQSSNARLLQLLIHHSQYKKLQYDSPNIVVFQWLHWPFKLCHCIGINLVLVFSPFHYVKHLLKSNILVSIKTCFH